MWEGEGVHRHIQTTCGLAPSERSTSRMRVCTALSYIDHLQLRATICADLAPVPGTFDRPLYSPSTRNRQESDAAMWEPATRKAAAFLRVLPALVEDGEPRNRSGAWATAYDSLCWLAATPIYRDTTLDLLRHIRCGLETWDALVRACIRRGVTSPGALISVCPTDVPRDAWPTEAYATLTLAAQRSLLLAAGLADAGPGAALVSDIRGAQVLQLARGCQESIPLRSLAVMDEAGVRRDALLQMTDQACACIRRTSISSTSTDDHSRAAWSHEFTMALFWLTLADDDIRALTACLSRYAVPDCHVRRAARAWSAAG